MAYWTGPRMALDCSGTLGTGAMPPLDMLEEDDRCTIIWWGSDEASRQRSHKRWRVSSNLVMRNCDGREKRDLARRCQLECARAMGVQRSETVTKAAHDGQPQLIP